MEAGFEHLTRGTAESVGILLVVVEPGLRAMKTAEKITSLARQLRIQKVGYIVNKVHSEGQKRKISERLGEDNIWAVMPFDFQALEADLSGISPYEQCPDMCETSRELIGKLQRELVQKK